MLSTSDSLPAWAWWGMAFIVCAGFELWRVHQRRQAGVADAWGVADHVAMGGLWLSVLLLLFSALLDLGNIDLGDSVNGF